MWVEFRFNNIVYAQINGVSMDSIFGPVITNIYVGFPQKKDTASLIYSYVMWTTLFPKLILLRIGLERPTELYPFFP